MDEKIEREVVEVVEVVEECDWLSKPLNLERLNLAIEELEKKIKGTIWFQEQ